MTNYKQQAERWLKQAENDLATAQALLDLKNFSGACFFSEQSAQKSLKAFLIKNKQIRLSIHAIAELLEKSAIFDQSFLNLVDEGKVLDKYYLTTRYPDALPDSSLAPFESYSKSEAEGAIKISQNIFNLCQQQIR